MGFEYQKNPFRDYGKWTYTDNLIDSIMDQKSMLEIDIKKELDVLKKLYSDVENQSTDACKKRDAIADWDSPEADEAENLCDELAQKLDALEDLIDYFEDLLTKF